MRARIPFLRSLLVWSVQVLVVAVVYHAAGRIGQLLAIPPGNVTAVWPPSGIALAAVLLLGYRVWPGIWLGSFSNNTLFFLGTIGTSSVAKSITVGSIIGVGAATQALVAAFLLDRFAGGRRPFDRTENVLKFAVLGAALSFLISATVGVTALCLGRFVPWTAYRYTWLTWWLGDATGVLVVAPVLLAWANQPHIRWKPRRLAEAALLVAALSAVGCLVFERWYSLEYLFMPFLMWATLRFGLRGAVTATVLASGLADWGTVQNFAPVRGQILNESLLLLQAFVAVVTLTILGLSAVLTERQRAKQELAEELARRAALAVDNARLYDAAQDEIAERQRAEAALRKSEAHFRALIENSLDSVLLLTADGTVLYASPAALRHGGFPAEEIVGRSGLDLVHPDDLRSVMKLFVQLLQRPGSSVTGEYRHRHRDGSWRWLGVVATNMLEETNIQAIVINSRDITDHKQAEETLRQSEARFRSLSAAAPIGIFETDRNGKCIYNNTRYQELSGMTLEDSLGDGWLRGIYPDDREAVFREWDAAAREGRQYSMEHRLLSSEGVLHWVHGRATAIHDADGTLKGYVGTVEDITERRRAAEELRQTAEKLHMLVDIAKSIGATLDLTTVLNRLVGRLVEHLSAAEVGVVYLYDPQARVLIPWACIGDEEPFRQFRLEPGESISGRVFQTGRSLLTRTRDETAALGVNLRLANLRILAHTCKWQHVQSTLCAPLRTPNGDVIGTVSLGSTHTAFDSDDLSVLEAAAAQAATAIHNARLFEEVRSGHERMQTLSHRLVELHEDERREIARELHDQLGQLLTGLKLVLEMSMRLPSDRTAESVSEALTLVGELMARVRDLSLELRPAMLDDLGLLPALLWLFERYTTLTNVRVTFKHTQLQGRFPPAVETAAYRIVQEALTNVARHAGVSKAVVRLRKKTGVLYVQIEDQGTGFDPNTEGSAGTSIGLTGMRERARLLGGKLTVASAPGTGTRLTAELPLAEPPRERHDDEDDDRPGG